MPDTRVRPSASPGVNLVPGIHDCLLASKAWMAGTSPAMTRNSHGLTACAAACLAKRHWMKLPASASTAQASPIQSSTPAPGKACGGMRIASAAAPKAMRQGSAIGAANALVPGQGEFDPRDADRILRALRVDRIA